MKLTELTDAQRTEALKQFHVIRPSLEEGVPLTRIATEHQLQLRTLRRWVQRYRADGLRGLIRPVRKDKGKKRAVTVELQQLVEGLAFAEATTNHRHHSTRGDSHCQRTGFMVQRNRKVG